MLQAMNTGHDGSITTVHSNSPRDTLSRIETMTLMAGMDLPVRVIREQMASALDMIVHLTRLRDGTRRVTHVSEVMGMEGDVVVLQDIYTFDFARRHRRGGPFRGGLSSTGIRPSFSEKLNDYGIALEPSLFAATQPAARRSSAPMSALAHRHRAGRDHGQPREARLRAAASRPACSASASRSSSCRATARARSNAASATSCRNRARRPTRTTRSSSPRATRPSPRPRSCSAWSASPVGSPTAPVCSSRTEDALEQADLPLRPPEALFFYFAGLFVVGMLGSARAPDPDGARARAGRRHRSR